jgi:dolichol-phosphate mannosyltransferase
MSMESNYPARPLVIIPTCNQRSSVGQLIPAIMRIDDRLHILIVDGGSTDETAAAVVQLQEGDYAPRLFLNSLPGKPGLRNTYVNGFGWGLAGGYDFLIQMDWRSNPGYLGRMLQSAGKADFVIGSRYVSKSGTPGWGTAKRILPKFGNLYAHLLLGLAITDFTGGFTGWSASVLRALKPDRLNSDGCAFQIELKYRAHMLGFKHVEFPVDDRRAGKSGTSAVDFLGAFWRVWRLLFWNCGTDGDCVENPSFDRGLSAGKSPFPQCPKCGSTKLIPNVSIRDQGNDSDGKLSAYVDAEPEAMIFKDRLYSGLIADICGECGHVELRAERPGDLYKHYLQSNGKQETV